MEPQVLTITAWEVLPETAELLDAQKDYQKHPMAVMAMNSVNMKSSTLCHMGAFILRQLAKQFGLERASEIVFQTAQTMTMKAQFQTGPEEELDHPYDPTDDCGDTEPDWDDDDDDDAWKNDEGTDYN